MIMEIFLAILYWIIAIIAIASFFQVIYYVLRVIFASKKDRDTYKEKLMKSLQHLVITFFILVVISKM